MLKPPLCVCVCVFVCVSLLGFYAPLTTGRPPAVPYVLITPGAFRRQCLAVYVTSTKPGTADSASCVYARVFMSRLLLWSGNNM